MLAWPRHRRQRCQTRRRPRACRPWGNADSKGECRRCESIQDYSECKSICKDLGTLVGYEHRELVVMDETVPCSYETTKCCDNGPQLDRYGTVPCSDVNAAEDCEYACAMENLYGNLRFMARDPNSDHSAMACSSSGERCCGLPVATAGAKALGVFGMAMSVAITSLVYSPSSVRTSSVCFQMCFSTPLKLNLKSPKTHARPTAFMIGTALPMCNKVAQGCCSPCLL